MGSNRWHVADGWLVLVLIGIVPTTLHGILLKEQSSPLSKGREVEHSQLYSANQRLLIKN
jgi:hypothetical protein